MKPTLFIQANDRQMLGARIAAHSARRNSKRPDSFHVRILHTRDYPRLMSFGQAILRGGAVTPWDPTDLQSFSPLRFAAPAAASFAGRAVVIDPDCFAIGDVSDLFEHDMRGKTIMAVERQGDGLRPSYLASSVMLLDCAGLTHWDFEKLLDGLFEGQFDYLDWIALKLEEAGTIDLLEPRWNDFDRLAADTGILHTTRRRTQPWKTGLPIDFVRRSHGFRDIFRKIRPQYYRRHPDPRVEALVYSLLAEMVDSGEVSQNEIIMEMSLGHIRHDSIELIERYRGKYPSTCG